MSKKFFAVYFHTLLSCPFILVNESRDRTSEPVALTVGLTFIVSLFTFDQRAQEDPFANSVVSQNVS